MVLASAAPTTVETRGEENDSPCVGLLKLYNWKQTYHATNLLFQLIAR
jgi:hypothetical protein